MAEEQVSKLKQLVEAVGGHVQEEYEALLKQCGDGSREARLAEGLRSRTRRLVDRLAARVQALNHELARFVEPLAAVPPPAEQTAAGDEEQRAAPVKRKRGKKSRKAGAKKAVGTVAVKSEPSAGRKLQGTYIGFLRHSPKKESAMGRKIAGERGVAAAVEYFVRCRRARGEPLPPSLASQKQSGEQKPEQKARGKRGAGVRNPGKAAGAANGGSVDRQLELLSIASEHGGKIPEAQLDAFVQRYGLRSRAQAMALFAHTQGKLRSRFVDRAITGLTTKEATDRLRELARYFGVPAKELLAEALS